MTKIRRRRALSRARWRRARLHEPRASAHPYDDDKRLLDIEIHAITTQGGWYGMLAFIGFVTVTLMGVKDTDFFAYGAETTLPAIGVGVPTTAFFYIGALATTALYVYLHLHLARLWDMIAQAPAEIDGTPLAARIYPTLMTEWATAQRFDRGGGPSSGMMSRLKRLAAHVLVWQAAPIVVGAFWVKSWPKHDLPMTLWISLCLMVCVFVGFVSLRGAAKALQPVARRPRLRRIVWPVQTIAVVLTLAAVPSLGAVKSKLGLLFNHEGVQTTTLGRHYDFLDPIPEWLAEQNWMGLWPRGLSRANLYRVEITEKPEGWQDQHIWIKEFRAHWCERETSEKACWEDLSEEQRAAFEQEAKETRDAYLYDLNKPDLTCTGWLKCPDLRGAEAREAFMPGVNARMANFAEAYLDGAQMQGASLREAQMQRAYLREAQLQGADLGGAQMQGAYLGGAQMQRAYLGGAQMQGASLSEAQMQRAYLGGAQMQGASLSEAQMQGAYLSRAQMQRAALYGAQMQGANLSEAQMQRAYLYGAQMQGANLSEAQMQGAVIRRAQMQGAGLNGAQMQGVDLYRAQMQGVDLSSARFGPKPGDEGREGVETAQNLTQAQLSSAAGDNKTILPRDAVTGEQLWVFSCLTEFPELPEGVQRPWWRARAKCAAGQEPERVGTPTGTQSPNASNTSFR